MTPRAPTRAELEDVFRPEDTTGARAEAAPQPPPDHRHSAPDYDEGGEA